MKTGDWVDRDIKTIPRGLVRGGRLEFKNGLVLRRAPNGIYHYKPEGADIAGFATEQQMLDFINENKPWRLVSVIDPGAAADYVQQIQEASLRR